MLIGVFSALGFRKGLMVASLLVLANGSYGGGRETVSLDGLWAIAQGSMAKVPSEFPAKVVVPGLADLAQPAFDEVGVESDQREAFWYRRTFKLEGAVPDVARLKIHKAKFGTLVFVNGKKVGEHLPCFTPGYFDVAAVLRGKGEENEIVVRVGATQKQLPDYVPYGADFEKERYIPGIFDSVELILTSNPRLENIQAVPFPESGKVGVQVEVVNTSGDKKFFKPIYTVAEKKSGKVVAKLKGKKVSVGSGQKVMLNETLKIKSSKLWTPETPFLYTVTVDTGADELTQSFGMRSFRFDPKTGFALLNGQRRYLKGSNICIYRFFEDPARGDLVWDREWVRKLHRTIRELDWDTVRYSIGFAPDFWYDIADEEGVMIMDEYAFWYFDKCPESISSDQIAIEYEEWMRERWNHPSVVVWDACNESSSPKTGKAAMKVRHLDLSNRPWDNNTNPVMKRGDTFESHPYFYIDPAFTIGELPLHGKFPESPENPTKFFDPPSVVINEYPWLWIDRDGMPTKLTGPQWKKILGENATPEERREAYGYYYAILTEYWRSYRIAASVQHFTILTYSRPGGYTSDNFIDVKNLILEPNFVAATKRCFAPIGVMIESWEEKVSLKELEHGWEIPVVILNDLGEKLTGQVKLLLLHDGKTVNEQRLSVSIDPFGRAVVNFKFAHPPKLGKYQMEAEVVGMNLDTRSGKSIRRYSVVEKKPPYDPGIAVGKKVTASSDRKSRYFPERAVDGLASTRWSSERDSELQWFCVDLGKEYNVNKVEIVWEKAYGKVYAIEVSNDGKNFKAVYSTDSGDGGTDSIEFSTSVKARWVRMNATKTATKYGYSIYEFKVFGDPADSGGE